jgi:hypothetical protein
MAAATRPAHSIGSVSASGSTVVSQSIIDSATSRPRSRSRAAPAGWPPSARPWPRTAARWRPRPAGSAAEMGVPQAEQRPRSFNQLMQRDVLVPADAVAAGRAARSRLEQAQRTERRLEGLAQAIACLAEPPVAPRRRRCGGRSPASRSCATTSPHHCRSSISGRRWMTTLRKLPISSPRMPGPRATASVRAAAVRHAFRFRPRRRA